jgi:Bacterial Ig-like domain (group 2)
MRFHNPNSAPDSPLTSPFTDSIQTTWRYHSFIPQQPDRNVLMRASSRILTFVVGFVTLFPFRLMAQNGSDWRISPEKISIKVGEDRRLQLLNDLAQELHDAVWSIDDFSLAEIREEDGRAVVHAKAVGPVRVSATVGEQMRSTEIKICPNPSPYPQERQTGQYTLSVAKSETCRLFPQVMALTSSRSNKPPAGAATCGRAMKMEYRSGLG